MSATPVFVVSCDDTQPVRASSKGSGGNFVQAHNAQAAANAIAEKETKSLLVIGYYRDEVAEKTFCKSIFSQFAEGIGVTNDDRLAHFIVSFVDEEAGDLIQYRCDRLTDIDSVVEEEGSENTCGSVWASLVRPGEETFTFSDLRLTFLALRNGGQTGEELLALAKARADTLGCRFTAICVHHPAPEHSSCSAADAADAVAVLRAACARETIGRDERVSSSLRLQDVRAWSLLVNERHRWSATEPGFYLVNLNPRLVVGEKLAHKVCPGVSYIVADGGNAGCVDFVVFPPAVAADAATHQSVYSPHCRLELTEDGRVEVKPECGMTYLNGAILSDTAALAHNDRLIIGKQLAFRFVEVTTDGDLNTPSSRILDWELCCAEFREQSRRALEQGERNQRECELQDAAAAPTAARGAQLILTNPPKTYDGPLVWSLPTTPGASVTVGDKDGAGIALPFLKASATLTADKDGVVATVDKTNTKLRHAAQLHVGGFQFLYSAAPPTAADADAAQPRTVLPASEEVVSEVALGIFDLQWALALLFDFAFPRPHSSDGQKDAYKRFRACLCDDSLMTAPALDLARLAGLHAKLTSAVRCIGAELAASVIPDRSTSAAEQCGAEQAAFLSAVKAQPELEARVLARMQMEAGRALLASGEIENNSGGGGGGGRRGRGGNATPRTAGAAVAETAPAGSFEEAMVALKGTCLIPSAFVASHVSHTTEVMSVSANPKGLCDKYVKALQSLTAGPTTSMLSSFQMQRSLLLAIIDAALSVDYCVRKGHLGAAAQSELQPQLAEWRKLAASCAPAAADADTSRRTRSAWSHDAAVQRKPTPHLRRPKSTKPAAASGNTSTTNAAAAAPSSVSSQPPLSLRPMHTTAADAARPKTPRKRADPPPPPPATASSATTRTRSTGGQTPRGAGASTSKKKSTKSTATTAAAPPPASSGTATKKKATAKRLSSTR